MKNSHLFDTISDSSDRLILHFVTGSKASIFVRKTLQVRPRDQKRERVFKLAGKGPAFFDEDDVCCRFLELRCSLSELFIVSET